MMHLPTTKQLKEFLKDNKKTIWLTAFARVLLYVLGIAYTLFSNDEVEEEQENRSGHRTGSESDHQRRVRCFA